MKKPFFSIVIPTYNRSNTLSLLMKNIYMQTFKDFEIIIQDNNSTDNTKKLIDCFRIKFDNIRYYKNSINIGTGRNLYQGIQKAGGHYIFLMGDDDLILDRNCLLNVYKQTLKKEIGFIRLKFIYHNKFKYLFTYFANKGKEDIFFPPNTQNLQIYEFLYKYFQFISGVIFKNVGNKKISLLENANDYLYIDSFYISYLFKLTKKYGAMVMNNDIIIATWSPMKNNTTYYNFIDNKAYFEEMWKFNKPTLNNTEMENWKKNEINNSIFNLPSVKYYSSNKNLLLTFKRIIKLNKKLIFFPSTYLFFTFALLCPKIFWDFLRYCVYWYNRVRNKTIITKFNNLKEELSI